MKVILIQEVPDLGRAGDQVDVARGYARNFLIPRRLAVEATSPNLRALEQIKAHARQREERVKQEAETVAERLRGLTITIARPAGEQDRLFGSVTSSDVAEALARQGIHLDRKKIALEGPIKALGTYAVSVRLHRETVAEVQVQVVSG
ncbi:MAG: 50S ribosomal protein L9 [candidate division NC10 bacterium]|jgi:large subunit ribosomal protein L9|nr:50S ribosomal protein L9 [candidate division NC10 bacterium]MCH7896025.1 50S ribosomal protein L9 [candidate division NC10 bacterium]MCZ6552082.1 50S ribosomal protein L9 [candidate division NC10 bacterium]